jgi:integrase
MAITNFREPLPEDPATSLTGAVVKVLADTGMRIGELVNLKVSDIDEQAGAICIASDESSDRQRRIPLRLGCEALSVLRAHRGDSEYVLGDSAAGRMRRTARQFKEIAERLGIASHSLHSLRVTFGATLVKSGVNPQILQQVMGNRSIETTVRYYLRSNANHPWR